MPKELDSGSSAEGTADSAFKQLEKLSVFDILQPDSPLLLGKKNYVSLPHGSYLRFNLLLLFRSRWRKFISALIMLSLA